AYQLDLAGVETGTDAEAERCNSVPDPTGAVDRAGRPVERGERSVTRRFDEPAAEALDVRTEELVMRLADELPRGVTQGRGALGGADDVGEENGREHTVCSAGAANAGHELFDLVEERLDLA